jgi:hypothetical protein
MIINDAGYPEIVGEATRGGTPNIDTLAPIMGGGMQYDILGELMQKSPAFANYMNQRAANSRPLITRQPLQKARDWQLDFGPTCSGANTSTTITVAPQCLFRGEKVMATDTGSPVGTATRIQTILIGNRLQRPASTSTLTTFFSNGALGNGIKWDTCERALSIAITVSYTSACTFDMTVFGKAVL